MPRVRTGDFDCFYEDDDFTDPWRESETLLIQHGFGRNARYWNRWVPHLAGHYRVIRRDMRAHGGSSDSGPDYVWSVEGLVEDLVAFLDALGLERVHYVGESVGGHNFYSAEAERCTASVRRFIESLAGGSPGSPRSRRFTR